MLHFKQRFLNCVQLQPSFFLRYISSTPIHSSCCSSNEEFHSQQGSLKRFSISCSTPASCTFMPKWCHQCLVSPSMLVNHCLMPKVSSMLGEPPPCWPTPASSTFMPKVSSMPSCRPIPAGASRSPTLHHRYA